MSTSTTLPPMFAEDLAQMRAGDIDGMLGNYHPDAQIVRLPDVVSRGAEQVREFLEGYVGMQPKIVKVLSIKQADDTVVYHSTIEIGGNRLGIVGTWVLREGKIWRQTAVIVPPTPDED
jgi:ketosteroid isomerase-like protein